MTAKPSVGTLVQSSHALAASLLGAWLFNEGSGTTAADSSGHGNDITLDLSHIAWSTSSIFSGPALACTLTGATTGGTLSGIALTGGAFSLEVWLTIGGPGTYAALFTEGISKGLFLHSEGSTTWKADYYQGGDHKGSTAVGQVNCQLIVTYDGSTLAYYLNGAADGTVSFAGASFTAANIINDAAHESFDGIYDLLRVWSGRTLDADEVAALYSDPFAMYAVDASPTNVPQWLSSWSLPPRLRTWVGMHFLDAAPGQV